MTEAVDGRDYLYFCIGQQCIPF